MNGFWESRALLFVLLFSCWKLCSEAHDLILSLSQLKHTFSFYTFLMKTWKNMKKNPTEIKASLIVSTWNLALKNWEPQQGGSIPTGHRDSATPRTSFLILSQSPARISWTLWSVHAMTHRKISAYFLCVAGGSVFQEHHIIRRILHCSTDRITGKQLRHAQALVKSWLYIQWFSLNSWVGGHKRNVFYYMSARWNDPIAKLG